MDSQPSVVIVGAGLVGALAAVYFARRGYKVDVFEQREDLRLEPYVRGRSINLALSQRGISALEKVSLAEKVLSGGIPMKSRMIHVGNAEPHSQPYGLEGQAIYSIDRRKLNELLLEESEKYESVSLHFNHELIHADLDNGIAHFYCIGTRRTAKADFIIGADGIYSAVRREIGKKTRMNLSQTYIAHGYKEVSIFPKNGQFAMDPNSLHIWPRKSFMMIALPNQDHTFTCTLFFPFELFDSIRTKETLVAFFQKEFPDALDIIGADHLVADFFSNPVGSLGSISAKPYHYRGNALIIGDASHAMVPFYGQGMNAGFEDVEILDELLTSMKGKSLDEIFSTFTETRHPQAKAICCLAVDNYHEMSSSVISPLFQMQKKVGNFLHSLFPETIIPLYTMVAFSKIPYDQVVEKRNYQSKLINGILLLVGSVASLSLVTSAVFIRKLIKLKLLK